MSRQRYSDPYLAGIGLGLVLLASFVVAGRGLGASGAFASAAAATVAVVAPDHVNGYFAGYLGGVDWLVFEILGVFIGGFLSGLIAGRWRREV
ncbi:MAG: YeeE/YedE thiosulfate transporter family protein, partial [Thermoanaerobaculia bacterium]